MSPQSWMSEVQRLLSLLLLAGCVSVSTSGLGWDSSLLRCLSILSLMTSRRGFWGLYGVYDLLQTREHLLWFWGFLIVISVWLLRWICWRIPTVLFCMSKWVWSLLCRLVIYFLVIGFSLSLLASWFPLLSSQFVSFSWQCALSSSVCNRSVDLGTLQILQVSVILCVVKVHST